MSRAQLHALLLNGAERAPERAAYVRGGEVTSYGELAERAARLAYGLREAGVRPGDRVGLVLDGRVEYLMAYYGVLMAGGAVVPLNPDTRPNVLRHALAHAQARGVVIGSAEVRHLAPVVEALPALSIVAVVGEGGAALSDRVGRLSFADLLSSPGELRDAGAADEHLASVSYTSGTTGPAKGVMLAHRNLVANVRSIVEYLELVPDDRVAMVLPHHYVYGNSVLHTHLAVGAAVIEAGSVAFPVAVLGAIEEHRCTGLSGVPSTFARLTRVEDLRSRDLGSLRYVTQAGAPMSRQLTDALRHAIPQARIFVMYGQTEATARLSYLPPEDLDRKPGSVGIAIPGVELAVVDADGRPVPEGTVGEVVARGDNVMLGYLDDPDATARALRGGVLHTGDLGRMDAEGYLYLVGRQSEMIKSGGHRIGPQEVEEVIAAIPGVAECAVAGVPDEVLGQAIAAFVVLEEGTELDERAVKKECFEHLPRFKMPTLVRFVDALPRSDRGKILRSQLVDVVVGKDLR